MRIGRMLLNVEFEKRPKMDAKSPVYREHLITSLKAGIKLGQYSGNTFVDRIEDVWADAQNGDLDIECYLALSEFDVSIVDLAKALNAPYPIKLFSLTLYGLGNDDIPGMYTDMVYVKYEYSAVNKHLVTTQYPEALIDYIVQMRENDYLYTFDGLESFAYAFDENSWAPMVKGENIDLLAGEG